MPEDFVSFNNYTSLYKIGLDLVKNMSPEEKTAVAKLVSKQTGLTISWQNQALTMSSSIENFVEYEAIFSFLVF